jgi:hypothetical protein
MSTFHRVIPDIADAGTSAQRMLALSAEVAGTRACLIEPVGGVHRLVGWLNLARSGEVMMPMQVAETCRRLGQRMGCALWDEELNMPFMRSINPVRFPPVQLASTTISARGPVRVFLGVLTADLSGAATRAAVAASPATIVGEVVYDIELDATAVATMIANSQADVIVIAGGYDRAAGDALSAMQALVRTLAQALSRLPRSARPVLIYAGSVQLAERTPLLVRAVDATLAIEVVENVLPIPDMVHRAALARVLGYQYWRLTQRIIGFKEMARWATSPGQPITVETSFVQMMQAWAFHQSLPYLHGLYCSPLWWLHVWTGSARQGAQLLFTDPGSRPESLDHWPPLALVSGDWPTDFWPRPANAWWDKRGLAPVVAALGQVAPHAMMDVLENDLLVAEALEDGITG